jgi:hypothetical protein
MVLLGTIHAQESLPDCRKTGVPIHLWSNCYGSVTLTEQRTYAGEWQNGRPEGSGIILYLANGSTYTGEMKLGLRHGKGELKWADGGSNIGYWKSDKMDGLGTHTWSDGSTYVGEYKNDLRNGYGIFRKADGSSTLNGLWANDKFVGSGQNNNSTISSSDPIETAFNNLKKAFDARDDHLKSACKGKPRISPMVYEGIAQKYRIHPSSVSLNRVYMYYGKLEKSDASYSNSYCTGVFYGPFGPFECELRFDTNRTVVYACQIGQYENSTYRFENQITAASSALSVAEDERKVNLYGTKKEEECEAFKIAKSLGAIRSHGYRIPSRPNGEWHWIKKDGHRFNPPDCS